MLWRILILLVGAGFVAYRVALALEIRKARRSGDRGREHQLRTRGFGLYRWAAAAVLILMAVLTFVVWSNSR
jgi:hypothetical protein